MKSIILPFMTSVLFAGSFIAAKYTTMELGPVTITLLRYIIAFVFLSAMLFHFKLSSLRVKKTDLLSLILLGLFGIVGYHYFFFLSLRYTQIANTAIINALSPITTGFLAAIFIKERLSPKNYFGVTLAFIGVMVLFAKGNPANLIDLNLNFGDLLMLVSVLSWVIYSLLIKKLLGKYTGFTLTYYATFFGMLLLMFLVISENFTEQIQSISNISIYSLLYMGICASGMGYFFYNLSINEIGPTKTASFVSSLVPIFVAGLALHFFNQKITGVMIISTLLIILGLHFGLGGKKPDYKIS